MDWDHWILENELLIRLGFFAAIFAIMAIWEILLPRRQLTVSKAMRWTNNLALVVLNGFVIRLLFPTAAVGFSILVEQNCLGPIVRNYLRVTPRCKLACRIIVIQSR